MSKIMRFCVILLINLVLIYNLSLAADDGDTNNNISETNDIAQQFTAKINNKLKTIKEDYEKKIKDLKNTIGEKLDQIAELKNQNMEKMRKNIDLKAQLDKLIDLPGKLKKYKLDNQQLIQEINKMKDNGVYILKDLNEKLTTHLDAYMHSKTELNNLREADKSNRKKIEGLINKINKLDNEVKMLKTQNSKDKATITELTNNSNDLSNQKSELLLKIKNLNQTLKTDKQTLTKTLSDNKVLKVRNETLLSDKEKLNKTIEQLKSQIALLSNRIDELKLAIDEKDNTIVSLKNEIKSLQNDLLNTNSQSISKESRISKLKFEKQDLESRINKMTYALAEYDTATMRLKAKIMTQEQKINELSKIKEKYLRVLRERDLQNLELENKSGINYKSETRIKQLELEKTRYKNMVYEKELEIKSLNKKLNQLYEKIGLLMNK